MTKQPAQNKTGKPCGHCTRLQKPCRYHGGTTTKAGGRNTKYEPQRVQRILNLIRAGSPQQAAALANGIGTTTLHEWKKRHPEFWEQLKEAEGASEAILAAKVAAHTDKDWKAAMTMLERRFPDRWARRDRVKVTGDEHQPLRIQIWQPKKSSESRTRRTSRKKPST